MMGRASGFQWLRWMLLLLFSLLWVTTCNATAQVERSYFGHASLAANSGARIGATGQIGETALKQLGGDSQIFFNTSQGGRYVDQLVNGIANEAKVGYQTLTSGMRLQVMKDVELIQTQQVQGAIWNFYRSPVTGKIGPSGPLGDLLNSNNIPFTLHY